MYRAFAHAVVTVVLLYSSHCGQLNIESVKSRPPSAQPTEAKTISFWNAESMSVSDSGEDQPVELGLKFKSSVPAQLTGIRFYKLPGNKGPHRGNVWSSDGRLLASTAFQHETPSGWQQAQFEKSVPMRPDETYTISYLSHGHYAFTTHFFDVSVSQPPLDAATGAGVFTYSVSSTFPQQSFQNTNYWIDPVVYTAPVPKSIRTVSLRWNRSTSPNVTYSIYRKNSSSGPYTKPALASGLKVLAYVDQVIAARGDEFYYVVRAVDSEGRESSDSNEFHVIIPYRADQVNDENPPP